MPLSVSVALCTFNGEKYIRAQLDSILAQTTPPSQIVVRDDGSTDRTLSVLEEYTEHITIVRGSANIGVAKNFEAAIQECTGELIALSDQDDIWEPSKITDLVAIFENDCRIALVGTNATSIGADGRTLGYDLFGGIGLSADENALLNSSAPIRALIKRPMLTGATMMFRRSLTVPAFPIPDGWLHDEWLAIIAASVGEVRADPRSLTRYRQHESNVAGVARNGLSRKIRTTKKLFSPRNSRYATLLQKRTSLFERLQSINASDESKALSLQALNHEIYRSTLPAARLSRIPPVIREWRTGRYGTVDMGNREILRDLLSAAR